MPTMDWTAILSGADIPAGWMVLAFIISNGLSFFLARGTSKDKVNSNMLDQTVKRQKELDERQGKMMDDLQDEFGRVRQDMNQIRQELSEERKRFTALSEKYSSLISENYHLKQLAKNLAAEKEVLLERVETLTEKNREATDEVMLLNNKLEEYRQKEEEGE